MYGSLGDGVVSVVCTVLSEDKFVSRHDFSVLCILYACLLGGLLTLQSVRPKV